MLSPSAAANLPSPPTPSSHSVFPAAKESGETSVLQSIRFIGSNLEVQILTCLLKYNNKIGFFGAYFKILLFLQQSEKQKTRKSSLKHYHLPAIERRGGSY